MAGATKFGFHGASPRTLVVTATARRGPENFYLMKEELKLVGWTVPISGDGIAAYNAAGADVITHGGSGANGMDNDDAYVVLEDPDSSRWILFSKQANGGSGGATWTIAWAVDAYLGGSATTLPTSASSRSLASANKEFLFRCLAPTGNMFLFACDNAAPWGMYAITWPAGGSIPTESFGAIPCIQPDDATDPDPHVYWADVTSANLGHEQLGEAQSPPDASAIMVRATAPTPTDDPQNAPAAWPGGNPSASNLTNYWYDTPGGRVQVALDNLGGSKAPATPIVHLRAGASTNADREICKGTNSLMLGAGARRTTDYDELDYVTWKGFTLIYAHDFLLVWPGSTAQLGTDRGELFVVGDLAVGSNDNLNPVITNFSPATTETILENTAIEFDITDAGGFAGIIVFAELADGSVEMIHDGFSFRGNYVGNPNSRTAITNGFHYRVRRSGGWPKVGASPTVDFEYAVFDTSGNVGAVS